MEEIENPSQDQPKWWRSGLVNLFGPLCPCLYGHLCPCPYSCLSFPFAGSVLTFLLGNDEKRRILSQRGVIPFGAFPVPIVTWGEGLPFTGPGSKPAYTVRVRWVQFHVSHVSPARLELLEGFFSHFFSGVNWVFQRKPLLMATNLYDLFKPLSFPVSHAHFWLRHRCFLRVSPKPSPWLHLPTLA